MERAGAAERAGLARFLTESASPGLRPVGVVAGPTASGKTGLALALARQLGAVIINADSLQLYQDLPLLTAQPTAAERAQVPHRLYGVLSAAETCTAARWREMALAEIAQAHASGRLPLLVGGTGLYLKALMTGLADIPPVPEAVRAAVRARLAAAGPQALHAELVRHDPDAAARLAPGDSQRLARALEVVLGTGQPLGWWQARGSPPPPDLAFPMIILDPPRAQLYAACDGRFRAMMAAGALEQVAAFLEHPPAADHPLHKALGVAALGRHLRGACPLAAAVAEAQTTTRHYAKRQVTWFRHQTEGLPIVPLRVASGGQGAALDPPKAAGLWKP